MRSFFSGKSEQLEIPISLKEYDSELTPQIDSTLYVAQLQNRDLSCCVHFEQFGTSAITSCYGPWKPKFKLSQAVATAARVNVTLRLLSISDTKLIEKIQGLESKISQILTKIIQGKEYPGCYIDLNVCINTISHKVFSVIFNSCMFCLSRAGISLFSTVLANQDEQTLIVADVVSQNPSLYYIESEGEEVSNPRGLIEDLSKNGTVDRLLEFVVS